MCNLRQSLWFYKTNHTSAAYCPGRIDDWTSNNTRWDRVGEIFDPQIHEAVSMVEDDTLDDGTIIQEVAKGYISEKGILKPSKVIVSKKKEMEKKV